MSMVSDSTVRQFRSVQCPECAHTGYLALGKTHGTCSKCGTTAAVTVPEITAAELTRLEKERRRGARRRERARALAKATAQAAAPTN